MGENGAKSSVRMIQRLTLARSKPRRVLFDIRFPSGFRGVCLEAISPREDMLEGNLHISDDSGKKKRREGIPPS